MGEYYPNNPISDEDRDAYFREHAPKMVERLQAAVDYFFHGRMVRPEEGAGRGPTVNYDASEPVIQLDGPTIEIRPGIHEQKRIGGPARYVYRPAFDIITYKSEAATRWHPEDVWDVDLGTKENPIKAVEFALLKWFEIIATNYFDNVGVEEWAEEVQEEYP